MIQFLQKACAGKFWKSGIKLMLPKIKHFLECVGRFSFVNNLQQTCTNNYASLHYKYRNIWMYSSSLLQTWLYYYLNLPPLYKLVGQNHQTPVTVRKFG
jgi:hypothetical protein